MKVVSFNVNGIRARIHQLEVAAAKDIFLSPTGAWHHYINFENKKFLQDNRLEKPRYHQKNLLQKTCDLVVQIPHLYLEIF